MFKFKHPGSGYVFVICDVCHRKFRRKDVIHVTDPHNLQFGKVVCKADLDKINEQILPNTKKDRTIAHPETLRPERTDQFVVNLNDDRLPSAPRNLEARPHPINDTILLQWQGPEDNGSSGIIGYKVARAYPQWDTLFPILATTNTPATTYEDAESDFNTLYAFKVAAINDFGVGPYSNVAYWPSQLPVDTQEFILDGNSVFILDGDGNFIRSV